MSAITETHGAFVDHVLHALVTAVEQADTPAAVRLLRRMNPPAKSNGALEEFVSAMLVVQAAVVFAKAAEVAGLLGAREAAAFDAIVAHQKRVVEYMFAAAAAPTDRMN